MSYASKLKDELAGLKLSAVQEREALLCALTHTCAYLKIARGGISLEYVSENMATAQLAAKLAVELFQLDADIRIREQEGLKSKSAVASVKGSNCAKLVSKFGCFSFGSMEDGKGIVPEEYVNNEMAAKAFVRGAFLGSGSMNDPQKGYHLEIVCRHESFANGIKQLLTKFGLNARISQRKSSFMLYFKEGESISDFMRLIGAVDSTLEFENIRVMRFMSNDLNRKSNFEDANMQKTAHASAQQLIDIEYISKTKGLMSLPDNLRITAEARLNNPEATLSELAQKLNIGKSGVNHRLTKISSIAEDIRLHGEYGKGVIK